MEVLVVPVLVFLLFCILLVVLSGNGGHPTDNREPYLRDNRGHIWALKVAEGTPHEDFIHDGTAHQNPAVREEGRWWFIFHYTVEVSYYPLTIPPGRMLPDLAALQAQVSTAQQRGRDKRHITLDASLEREVIRRENGEQLGREVPAGQLAYKSNGRRR
jgi:hypothetical protein